MTVNCVHDMTDIIFVPVHRLLIAGFLLLAACSDPAEEAREQYMGACLDYRQSCTCQYDRLAGVLSDQELAVLTAFLADLKARTADVGAAPPEMVPFKGTPHMRREYFAAALACTRF